MGICLSYLEYSCDNETMCYEYFAKSEQCCITKNDCCSSLYVNTSQPSQPAYQLQQPLTEQIPEYYQRPPPYNPYYSKS